MSGARLHTLLPELTTRQSVMVVGAAVIDCRRRLCPPRRGCDIELKQQALRCLRTEYCRGVKAPRHRSG